MQKTLIIGILIMMITSLSYSQTAYKGGGGDGFGMAELKNVVIQNIDEAEVISFKVFPHPVLHSQGFVIVTDEKNFQVHLISSAGITCRSLTGRSGEMINSSELSSGIYIIELRSDQKVSRKKLVIQ